MMIGIIDYGLGNIQAFMNSFESLNIKAKKVKNTNNLENCTHLILPGVGSYDYAITLLKNSNLLPSIEDLVFSKNIPILGVCVGMQILGSRSEEGNLKGLNWIKGEVKSFRNDKLFKLNALPHMGWNNITINNSHPLFRNELNHNQRFYFLHSYYFKTEDKDNIICSTNYGIDFDSGIQKNNIFGVQFHPEKSHRFGLNILKNFSNL